MQAGSGQQTFQVETLLLSKMGKVPEKRHNIAKLPVATGTDTVSDDDTAFIHGEER